MILLLNWIKGIWQNVTNTATKWEMDVRTSVTAAAAAATSSGKHTKCPVHRRVTFSVLLVSAGCQCPCGPNSRLPPWSRPLRRLSHHPPFPVPPLLRPPVLTRHRRSCRSQGCWRTGSYHLSPALQRQSPDVKRTKLKFSEVMKGQRVWAVAHMSINAHWEGKLIKYQKCWDIVDVASGLSQKLQQRSTTLQP